MSLFSKLDKSPISLEPILLGNVSFKIPVATFVNLSSNQTVVITGGMDGDEYAGIEAAYELIEEYTKRPPTCTVVIIPIVNILGFEGGVSYNPLDKKFPKHFFPGKKEGTPTEQLLYWLGTKYLHEDSIWIDLHSGAITESITPFIRTYQTKNKKINLITTKVAYGDKKLHVHDKNISQKISNLTKKGIAYFMLESGQKGERDRKSIQQHLDWTKQIITSATTELRQSPPVPPLYTQIIEYSSSQKGLWYPSYQAGAAVKKNSVLGNIYSLDKKLHITIRAKRSGDILWSKTTMSTEKGEVLLGIVVQKNLTK